MNEYERLVSNMEGKANFSRRLKQSDAFDLTDPDPLIYTTDFATEYVFISGVGQVVNTHA